MQVSFIDVTGGALNLTGINLIGLQSITIDSGSLSLNSFVDNTNISITLTSGELALASDLTILSLYWAGGIIHVKKDQSLNILSLSTNPSSNNSLNYLAMDSTLIIQSIAQKIDMNELDISADTSCRIYFNLTEDNNLSQVST